MISTSRRALNIKFVSHMHKVQGEYLRSSTASLRRTISLDSWTGLCASIAIPHAVEERVIGWVVRDFAEEMLVL